MANRGRPRKLEISVWDKKYYRLSDKRDNQAIDLMIKERLMKAYNDLHILAFGIDMTARLKDRVRGML